MQYFSDKHRHLVCYPFSVGGLHAMAAELKISRSWFHSGRHPHYDIPKKRLQEIAARTEVVSGRVILRITLGLLPHVADFGC
jgi:hypothetical protein